MHRKSIYFILFLSLYACGPLPTEITEQNNDKLKSYDYPNTRESFLLSENQEVNIAHYDGPIIFWNNNVAVENFVEVLQNKKHVINSDLIYKKEEFKIDSLRIARMKLHRNISEANSEISKKDFNSLYQNRNEQLLQAETWLNANLKPDDVTKFNKFCQAMVWRFAVSDLIKNYKFYDLPLPLGMCQKFYQENNYFTAKECQNPNSIKKDYFRCFWGDSGVFNTDMNYFNANYDLLEDEVLEKYLTQLKEKAAKDKEFANKFILDSGEIEIVINNTKDSVLLDFSQEPFEEPIASIVDRIGGLDAKQELTMVLKNLIKLRTNQHDDGTETAYTLNDRIYNIHLIAKPQVIQIDLNDIEEFIKFSKINEAVYGPDATPVVKLLKEYISKINLLEEQLLPLEKVVNFYDQPLEFGVGYELEQKYRNWMERRAETAKYIISNKMAKAFWPYASLKVTSKESIMRVVLYLDDKQRQTIPAEGCFDLNNDKQLPCADFGLDKQKVKMDINIDQKTGSLHMTIKDLENEYFYLSPLEESPYFQDKNLSHQYLMTKELKLELLPGAYQETLGQMTGKAFLYDRGLKVYEASVSMTKSSLAKR